MFEKIELTLQSKAVQYFILLLVSCYVWFMVFNPLLDAPCSDIEMPCKWNYLLATWKGWQTFNAAIIAFMSTLLIIHITRLSEQNSAIKKRNAAKVFMPFALAEVTSYIKEVVILLDDLAEGKKPFKLELKPSVPDLAFKRIEKFIEESANQDAILVGHLTIAINAIQVFDARLAGLLKDSAITNKKERSFGQINQCILLHALISGMFDFTRGLSEKYNVRHLSQDKFWISGCPLYMTDPQMLEIEKREIDLSLFVSTGI